MAARATRAVARAFMGLAHYAIRLAWLQGIWRLILGKMSKAYATAPHMKHATFSQSSAADLRNPVNAVL